MSPSTEQTDRGRARLLFAAGGLVLVVLAFAISARSYLVALTWLDHTLEVRGRLDDWGVAVRGVDGHARRFVHSGRSSEAEGFDRSVREQRVAARALAALTADNPAQVPEVASAAADAELLSERFGQLVAQARVDLGVATNQLAESEDVLRGASDRFEAKGHLIQTREKALLLERRLRARERVLATLTFGATLGVLAFGLLIVVWSSRAQREVVLERAAIEARRRLTTLSELAVALSETRTASEVAGAVVNIGMAALGADTCTLYLLDDARTSLELIGERGVAPDVVERIRKLTAGGGNPVAFRTLETGEALWAENEAAYEKHFPSIAKLSGRRAKAFWSFPLIVENRPVGLLGMGYYEPRPFSADDRVLIDTLSKQCAQALLRATRLEGEEKARQWFTTTLRSIGDAVIATDPAGLVTFMNPVAEELTGFSEGEAAGRPLDEVFRIFSEQTRAAVESPVAKVLREGAIVGLANHTVLRSRRGDEIPIDDSGAPIRSESGELIGVVMVFRDVSREKADRARRDFLSQAGEALVGSLDYQATLSTVARLAVPAIADWCAIELLEPGARVSHQAAVHHGDPQKIAFVRELGQRYPSDPNAKSGAPEVMRSGKAELYEEVPAALLEAAAVDAEHLRLIRELGLYSAMVVPLKTHRHTLGAMTFAYAESRRKYGADDLVFAEDFARRAALAIENALVLRQVAQARDTERLALADAELASRAKDEFLAVVSHELRTPLNAILGWTVMLRTPGGEANLERGLAVIERNARAQAKLIEDVLDVSRIISGKLSLSLGPTIVAEIVSAAVETVTPAAAAKNISIEATLPSEPVTITADAQRLQQVVWNLLANAVKFTPKGGRVSVRAYREGSDACIEVRDNGEGIRPEALPHVFDAFQQADASITRRHGGLGLGLAIVKQLVTAHGGTVRATSDGPGQGATFLVELPARAAVSALSSETPSEIGTEPPPLAVSAPRLEGLRLLVVDDEEDALTLVTRVLTTYGAEVVSVASAREALEKVALLRPDVIVSDIGMPEEDGYSLMRRIRALPPDRGGRTPAVALTAYARSEDAQRAFAAGYQLHVSKPVEPAHLASVVANLGGRSLDRA